jgi:prolyl-tRNA editing enzyme YbaK/EbsC (Cys-tRNA(Pro) deacylase)
LTLPTTVIEAIVFDDSHRYTPATLADPVPDPRVLEALQNLGEPFELLPCEPDLADTAAFCAAYNIPLDHSANTIVIAAKRPVGVRVACVVLATHRLDVNGLIRTRMGVKKASFASAEETAIATGMAIGGVTPFALPEELPIWIDEEVMRREWVIVGAGSRTAKVRLPPTALLRIRSVEVVSGLATAQSTNSPDEEQVTHDPDQGE